MDKLFDIIFEDRDLLVINKPAGLVCHPTKGDEYSSLIGRVRLHFSRTIIVDPSGCGDGASLAPVKPHMIHRLDRETSGVVLVAKNSEAAGDLGKIWENRAVTKEYLAIVHGHIAEEQGIIDAPLGTDEKSVVHVKDCVRADGVPAQTEFRVERRFERNGQLFSLVRAIPHTGRKHQIRIHMEHIGHPIVGDKLYGGDEDIYLALAQQRLTDEHRRKLLLPNQALHAASLRFTWRGEPRSFHAEPEEWFREFVG